MLYIDDLQVESEVLPLFNFTYTYEAETVLRELLRELPPTAEQVREKQAIVQGFLAQWAVLADFHYSRLQLQEVRNFLAGVCSGRILVETNQAKAAVKLLFSEAMRYQSRARYVQLILFLRRLQQHYLHRLNSQAFPVGFRATLRVLSQFLERFALEDAASAIQEDAFSTTHIVRLGRQLLRISEEELEAFWNAFYRFEAYWSIAKGVHSRAFLFPRFHEAGLHLEEFYHPALREPVLNTLRLTEQERVLVLTGPNMSGKSTLLKAIGLCVYLAHAGLAVPAARCELPFFHSILVAINLRDSLRDGYSHFMAELQHLKSVLHAARSQGRTFAIFDELFRGTNSDDALHITRATLSGLTQFSGCHFFVSTHLLQLQSQLPSTPGISTYCIECVLSEGVPVFSYRLRPGWSTLKIGQLLFEKEGLNDLLRPA